MTAIKICGLTRADDAIAAADLGADYLGFIFVPSTPRFVTPEAAAEIAARVRDRRERPPKFVGVFRDASADYIREVVSTVGLDLVQLHGSEEDEELKYLGIPAVKTFRVGETLPDTTGFPSAGMFLFDTFDARRAGGTGRCFDWSLLALYGRQKPFFLSGGLTPENVAAAVSLVRPDAIDVASGVESQPGIKDREKLELLFERVRRG